MTMIKCPDCGSSVSDRMSSCPTCGAPIAKKSDRYSQFYQKPQMFQTEPRYEEPAERPRQKKSSKSTALSISAILISFMAFLTSFMAIAIASIKPKEVFVEQEKTLYQEVTSEDESKPEFVQKDLDTMPSQSENKKNSETAIKKQVVFNQDGILITATGIELNGSFMGHEVKFLIENNTEKNLVVQARDVSVNGYMVFTSMSAEVSSGKKINDSLTIDIDSLEESGIEDIEYIDFSFHIFNDDSWDDSIDTEMIHIETK